MNKITAAMDNGSTGSIGIITPSRVWFMPVPTQDYLHYGKKGSISKRLDREALRYALREAGAVYPGCTLDHEWVGTDNIHIFLERPFSGRFINAVVPAHRFFESTIITLEDLGLGYEVVDSRQWQLPMLGTKVKGSAELKKASRLRGLQLYPQLKDAIEKQGDADGLLIAHHFHHR